MPEGTLRPVGRGFIALYTLAYASSCLMLLAPLLVTLALKVNSLVGIQQAPGNHSLVAGVGSLVSLVGNPLPGGSATEQPHRSACAGRGWSRVGSAALWASSASACRSPR